MTKQIEIIYADSGGGHQRVAQAIGAAIQATDADCVVRLVNAVEISRQPFEQFSVQYPFMIRHAAWLYHLIYALTDNFFSARIMAFLLGAIFGKAVRQYLAATQADLLISCHVLVNLLMAGLPRKAKYASVITDPFSPHADSFSSAADLCIVSSEAAHVRARQQHIPDGKIHVAAHPVSGWAASEKRETLQGLGLAASLATLLITGGGDGLGKMRDVVVHLDESGLPIQMIVVCGNNQELYKQLKRRQFHLPICVLPFTEQMPSLLQAADVLISKAGPSTLFEAFQAGLPIVLFDAVLGQEAGNVEHICRNGAGLFCKSPGAVVDGVRRLILDPHLREQMSAHSLALAKPHAALDVAKACLSLIE